MSAAGILGMALIAVVGGLFLKQFQPAYVPLYSAVCAIVLLAGSLLPLRRVTNAFQSLMEQAGINAALFTILLKTIALCYICRFGSDLCRDAGETAVAGYVELAGKLLIAALSIPIIKELIQTISKLIGL